MSDQNEAAGRLRSPPFPAISLPKAVERAIQLYASERDHLVPLSSAARAWSMSPTSSAPIQTVGALKQYGLLNDEGAGNARKVRLTNDALRIIMDKIPNSPERVRALERCFLAPKAFADLWKQYGKNLPSDQTVLNYLTLERKLSGLAPFSEMGAVELLANYRLTMAFAAPTELQSDPQSPDDPPDFEEETMISEPTSESMKAPTPPPSIHSRAAVPLVQGERIVFTEEGEPGQQVKLVASGPLDEFMLDALENYIERQKRRLKRPEENN